MTARPFARFLALAGALCLLALAPFHAQGGPVARIPLQVVAGKLLVRCDLSTSARRIPVNLFVELESKCGLELHNQAAGALRAERDDGTTRPITVHFGALDLVVEQREHGDEEFLDDFTKWNSTDMGETAVVGKIGSRIWKDWQLTFDLREGVLLLSEPAAATDVPRAAAPGEVVLPITETNDQVWVTVRLADGTPRAMALGTARYDTTVDEDLAEAWGTPAGDVGEVRLGELRLDEYVAFRPVELNQVHVDGALGVLGLNVLEHFRVTVDRVNDVLRLVRVAPPAFPEEDLAFFRAMVEEEPEPLLEFLEQHGDVRLSREAATLLLDLAVDLGGTEEEFRTALEWIDRTTPEDLRCTSGIEQMKRLTEAGLPDAAVLAGELGLPSGRKDRYPEAVHEIHARMGRTLLEAGDAERAFTHLLSAAFGKQDDGRVNLDLGRYYEGQGRLRRAESRYVQALIDAETGAEAFDGLARVRAELGDVEPLSFDEVERRIEGKVVGFGAATRYAVPKEEGAEDRAGAEDAEGAEAAEGDEGDEDAEPAPRHVALVELFTNPNMERAGVQGGCLAFEGLRRHFEGGHAAFLTYHTPDPELVPLANELADESVFAYDLEGPRVVVIDGTTLQPGACRDDEVQALYDRLRGEVTPRLAAPAEFGLAFEARVEDGALEGALTVSGPARPDTVVQVVLAERGVLFPGRSGMVLHRMVARAGLTSPLSGVAWSPDDAGTQRFAFAVHVDEVVRANLAWLEARAEQGLGLTGTFGTAIDPRQLALVGIVRDTATNEVLQAAEFVPEGAEPEER